MQITEELEAIKSQMDEKGTTMTDNAPLVKIKQALTKIKNELIQMELRIGVVSLISHSLLSLSIPKCYGYNYVYPSINPKFAYFIERNANATSSLIAWSLIV